jgi:hypothetical protein
MFETDVPATPPTRPGAIVSKCTLLFLFLWAVHLSLASRELAGSWRLVRIDGTLRDKHTQVDLRKCVFSSLYGHIITYYPTGEFTLSDLSGQFVRQGGFLHHLPKEPSRPIFNGKFVVEGGALRVAMTRFDYFAMLATATGMSLTEVEKQYDVSELLLFTLEKYPRTNSDHLAAYRLRP